MTQQSDFVLVPRVPTTAMIHAAIERYKSQHTESMAEEIAVMWQAMLSAAPPQAAPEEAAITDAMVTGTGAYIRYSDGTAKHISAEDMFKVPPQESPSPHSQKSVAEAAEDARKVLAEIYTANCATLPEDIKSRIRRACMAVADALAPLGRRSETPEPDREKLVALAAELKSDANEGKFSFACEALNHTADRILAALGMGGEG